MEDLLGLTAIFIVSLITIIAAFRFKEISNIIFFALSLRVLILLFGHYIHPLPDSTSDAIGFEITTRNLAKDGFFNLLGEFDLNPFIFFSWLHAVPYSLFGQSILMGQSISLLFGIGTIFLTWKVASIVWDNNIANKVGWTMALFPSLVLYSVLFLREIYICFFLSLSLYGIVLWVKSGSLKAIIFAFTGFICATLFHGAMFVGALIFSIILIIKYLKDFFILIKKHRINFRNLFFIFLLFFALSLYFTNNIKISYLGNFKSINTELLLKKTQYAFRGDASWPEWTKAKSGLELIYKAPIRSIYFAYSPFPWDVKKVKHLIGLFDGLLYIYLSYLILFNLKYIWKDPCLRIILILLLTYLFVFGFGVGNFGTGIRHRMKFVFMFILLAAPMIKKFTFNRT